jgi:peptidyl-tRNA hydrolase, PTH1 family
VTLKTEGSAKGHNGVKSIMSALNNSDKFNRILIGIGRPVSHESADVAQYVL